MRKFIISFSLCMCFIAFVAVGRTYALPGGLLNGKPMIASKNGTANIKSEPNATDNNYSTSAYVSYEGGTWNQLAYTVPNKAFNINKFTISSTGGYFLLNFYNKAGQLIASYNTPGNGNTTATVNLPNVTSIRILNKAGNPMNIYEFDVFGTVDLSIPQNLKATPDTRSVDLKWDALADSDLAGYNVYLNGAKVNTSLVTSNTYHIPDLEPDANSTAFVSAVYQSGDESLASNTVAFKAYGDPMQSVILNVATYVDRLVFSWNADPNALNYVVYDAATEQIIQGVTGTSFSFTGLAPNVSKSIYVVGMDAYGRRMTSDRVTGTTKDPPPPVAPILSVGAKNFQSVTLRWNKVGVLYEVYNAETGSLIQMSAGEISTVNGLEPETDYQFYVIATDEYDRKNKSNTVSVTTSALPAVSVPRVSVYSVTQTSARAGWSAAGQSYKVYLDGNHLTDTSSVFYSLSNLQPNKTYTVKILAIDLYGRETPGEAQFTTAAPLPTPSPGNGSGGPGGGNGSTAPPVNNSGNPDLDKPSDELVQGAKNVKNSSMTLIMLILGILVIVFGSLWLNGIFKKKMQISKSGSTAQHKKIMSTNYQKGNSKSRPPLNLAKGQGQKKGSPAMNLTKGQSRNYKNSNSRRKYYVEKTYPKNR